MHNPELVTRKHVSQKTAAQLIELARESARAQGIAVTIAITDAGGHQVALYRDDDAHFLTIEVAINKAWTASAYGLSTHVWNAVVNQPTTAQLNNVERLMPVGGGYPLKVAGQLVGGIGISGGLAQQDMDACAYALSSLGFDVE
ncbi:TPA: heme-binding protein [Klebsiella aerogenes]|nr:heme-binding protein [Klebsiella aerogenes]HCT8623070.1 heme-binding protein [Klebsiella aerogenes]HCT8632701.1 heme-binding protein [Klebsiella aerogenes]HCT8713733.1 heme-binding protein [Klebsiella aerogenes]